MIILLSPAKSLNFDPRADVPRTQPRLKKDVLELADVMKTKRAKDLRALMKISQKLADLNEGRFKNFSASHTKDNSKQAMFAFTGDVYQGLEADTFTEKQIDYAQEHVRMLSGLYGLLRPLDIMQPYRLEMGTKLKTGRGENLYEFWGSKIAKLINKDLKATGSRAVINLASNEYFKSVDQGVLDADVYDIDFRELRDGKFKFISFSAKKARGYMTQYIVKKKLKDPQKIKAFDMEGYMFNESLSEERRWVFTR
ncbi:MAG: peroxide stress protein YaaA [Saprospiraceae bacterium]|nr:peroxide stress protein YaaA [Saprospiraceae bacterium]